MEVSCMVVGKNGFVEIPMEVREGENYRKLMCSELEKVYFVIDSHFSF